ncbi:hypothetical protein [Citrobacter braakii]|uniref:hypothetical protein n=1 Tax=Citrobacter braakii TaxID=57706 RepID=UPI0039B367EC
MNRTHALVALAGVVIIATLAVLLSLVKSDLNTAESDKRVLESDNALQGQVIATQAFNINHFNQTAMVAARANAIVAGDSEKTVIEYREILRREKTCDLPVPAAIAGGLLEYANRLRSSAMHPDSVWADSASSSAPPTSTLNYCQAVLWIQPLLAAIETANNQLAGIREIEVERKKQIESEQ